MLSDSEKKKGLPEHSSSTYSNKSLKAITHWTTHNYLNYLSPFLSISNSIEMVHQNTSFLLLYEVYGRQIL